MLKYLELLLDLLRTSNVEEFEEMKKMYLAVWKKQEERWWKWLKIFHKNWFIFSAYDDLRTDKINLDEFLAIWDVLSDKKLVDDRETSIDFFNGVLFGKNETRDTLLIVDSLSFNILSDVDKKKIQDRVKDYNNELVLC